MDSEALSRLETTADILNVLQSTPVRRKNKHGSRKVAPLLDTHAC